jgi:hypothetical protein
MYLIVFTHSNCAIDHIYGFVSKLISNENDTNGWSPIFGVIETGLGY